MFKVSSAANLHDHVEALIRAGAESLFMQHRHSIGYLLGGEDDIVETNIILHISSVCLSSEHAVWAESPFKVDGQKSIKHMDLLVDLNPRKSDAVSALLVEAKRLRSLDGTSTIEDIIKDCLRIESWPYRLIGQRPIFFEFTQVKRALGAVVVLLPDETLPSPDSSATPLFSEWWMNLEGHPKGFDKSRLDELRHFLEPMKRGVYVSPFSNEGVHQVVVYALSEREFEVNDEDLITAKHEAAHIVVAKHFGLPVRYVSIEEYESDTDTALNGRMYCDWQSLKDSRDNTTLCTQTFAVAYAGAWLEALVRGWPFPVAYEQLSADQRAAAEIRQCLMQWTGVELNATEKESEAGAELARSVVINQMPRIERLADHLVTNRSMEEDEVSDWFIADS